MTAEASGNPSGNGHNFHPSILREYDIRGTVGQTLGEADARALGRAYASLLRRHGGSRISVAYDGRITSPELEAALVEGLTSAGIDVLRCGLGPTPMLYYSVFEYETDGGIMVTGSHNPPDSPSSARSTAPVPASAMDEPPPSPIERQPFRSRLHQFVCGDCCGGFARTSHI